MELSKIQNLLEEKYGKKSINEYIEGINETGIGYLIPYTMYCIGQIHIWHLLCTSGQKHTALGDLYDDLVENIDELAEKFIAQGGMILESDPFTYSNKYEIGTILKQVDGYRQIISSTIESCGEAQLKSLQDALIDIQENVDSFKYKFNLD